MPLLAANKLFPWISPFLASLLTTSWLTSSAAKFMPEAGGRFVWGWRKIWSSVKFSGPDGAPWFVCLCQYAIHHNYLCADVSFDWTLMCWALQTRKYMIDTHRWQQCHISKCLFGVAIHRAEYCPRCAAVSQEAVLTCFKNKTKIHVGKQSTVEDSKPAQKSGTSVLKDVSWGKYWLALPHSKLPRIKTKLGKMLFLWFAGLFLVRKPCW